MVHQDVWVGEIAEGLAHLATVVTGKSAGRNNVFVGVFGAIFGFFAESTDFGKGGIDAFYDVSGSVGVFSLLFSGGWR